MTNITLDGVDAEAISKSGQAARTAFFVAEKQVHFTAALEMATDTLDALPNARFIELGDSDQGYGRVWAERLLDENREEIIDSEDGEADPQEVIDGLSDLASYLPMTKPSHVVHANGSAAPGTDPDYAWYIEDREGNRFIDIAVVIEQFRSAR